MQIVISAIIHLILIVCKDKFKKRKKIPNKFIYRFKIKCFFLNSSFPDTMYFHFKKRIDSFQMEKQDILL